MHESNSVSTGFWRVKPTRRGPSLLGLGCLVSIRCAGTLAQQSVIRRWCRQIVGLSLLSGALLLAAGCDEADQIGATIELTLRIVDVRL